ncbi:signal peptidase I [Microbispora sp. H10885]|uniref:signal peptidase I n=1 Tax=Microbispora sp. H10885 TaxID=2729110 RepID=UPI001C719466|nr:signal peptidase I [Microbispora sp. H10885]
MRPVRHPLPRSPHRVERRVVTAALVAAVTVAAALVVRRCLVVVDLVGRSMEPAYRDGDRLLVRRSRRPRADDVVVFFNPLAAAGSTGRPGRAWMVKRVVAVAGEPVPEEVAAAGERVAGGDGAGSPRVPPGHMVVLGDNRGHSLDSRQLGPVPVGLVLGRVVRRISGGR